MRISIAAVIISLSILIAGQIVADALNSVCPAPEDETEYLSASDKIGI